MTRALLPGAALFFAVACARPSEKVAEPPVPRSDWKNPAAERPGLDRFASAEGASCPLSGRLMLDTDLWDAPSEGHFVSDLQGEVGIEILALSPRGGSRSRVRLRAPAQGPALVIEGWLDDTMLRMRLVRRVEVVPGHAWFEQGSLVEVVAGNAERVRIRDPDYHCYSDFDVTADADCSVLALDEKGKSFPGPPKEPPPTAESLVQPRRTPLWLLDDRGKPVIELGFGVFELLGREGSQSRVRMRGALNLLGRVPSSNLEPLNIPDRDDCGENIRDRYDRCPDEPQTFPGSDGCPEADGSEVLAAPRDIPLRLESSPGAKIVAHIEKGARIAVPRAGGPVVPVEVDQLAIRAPNGGGFWALASDARP